jgi:membrane protease YdiL (CAAX protease family)
VTTARAISPPAGVAQWERTLAVVVTVGGIVLLTARPYASIDGDARSTLFIASYAVIAAASIVILRGATDRDPDVGVFSGGDAARAGLVLAIGMAAVVVAGIVAGAGVPAPTSGLTLFASVLAAVAEEALFRGVAYARLERFGAAIALVGSAVLFALVHLPVYGTTAMPVDLGAGLLLGWQRYASRTWTVPAATHAFANILASLR